MTGRSKDRIIEFLASPQIKLATVSGIWSTKPDIIRWIDEHIPAFDVITTKSFQVHPNPGNREPIIAEKSVGTYSNAVGLRNPGMLKVYEELKELHATPRRTLLNVSISGSSPEEFIQLVKKFEKFADLFELNFSCPHAKPGYGSTIGSSAELVEVYTQAIAAVTDRPVFPKLTPNVPNVGEIAAMAKRAGADGLVAINTLGPEQVIEPYSGQPVLYNPNGRKGGISGEEIFPVALKQIAEIRDAVGPDMPIIGMGGVSSPRDAREMAEAGAQTIGLGSIFVRVRFQDRITYMKEFREALDNKKPRVTVKLLNHRQAEYHEYEVCSIRELSSTMRIFQLRGEHTINFKPGQYAFLWIPDAGEKPFSIVNDAPMEFIVRKRHRDQLKKSGIFTEALFELEEGDKLYARGPYGQAPDVPEADNIFIISGGTGIAAVPSFVKMLKLAGKNVFAYHGLSHHGEEVYDDPIADLCSYRQVADLGTPGRVLQVFAENMNHTTDNYSHASDVIKDSAFYIIGPEIFMEKGLAMAKRAGFREEHCFASLETNNMCGIGICGECECGGELSCHRGTFYAYTHLKKHYFKNLP